TGSGVLAPARFLISFAVLIVPTALMGATLPVLSHFLVRTKSGLGRTVGALYALNSLGAVAGAASAGFVLLPQLGKIHTNVVAVACNITLGLLAIAFGSRGQFGVPISETTQDGSAGVPAGTGATGAPARGSAGEAPAAPSEDLAPLSPAGVKAAVVAFGVTGFAAMATQIGWTRAISLCTGCSTYAFSLIVAVFILGLSLGGMWGARAAPRTRDPLGLLALVLLLIGLLNMVVAALLGYGPYFFFLLLAWCKQWDWGVLLAVQALGIALLIILPTVLMGATLPLTLQVASRSAASVGRTVGTVYAINTLGAILGSFLGGLVLLPLLLTQTLLEAMALLYVFPGLLLFWLSHSRREKRMFCRFGIVLALLFFTTVLSRPWDKMLMSSGMYLMRNLGAVKAAQELRIREALPDPSKDGTVLYFQEGAEGNVAVWQMPQGLSLHVGGKPDATSYGDMPTQVCLTLVPELLHESGPEEVLVIGLGSGVSAGCALELETVKHVDVVEMSRQVVEASWFFRKYNGLAYPKEEPCLPNTPKLELMLNDGRNHLLLSSRKYDVISSEPSNPWITGIGNLFTKEAFELARSRLKPGGIMCQWLQSYTLEDTHFYSVFRTFSEVFPHIQLWNCHTGDYLLIGSEDRIRIPVRRLEQRLAQPAVRARLERVHFDTPFEFLACFLGEEDVLSAQAASAPLHTDDNMLLEFQAPRALYMLRQSFKGAAIAPYLDPTLDFSGLKLEERAEFGRGLDLAISAREHTRHGELLARDAHNDAAFALAPYQFLAVERKNIRDEAEADRLRLGLPAKPKPDPAAAVKILTQVQNRSQYVLWSRPAMNHALADDAARLIEAGDAAGALAQLDRIDASDRSDWTFLRARALLLAKDYDRALAQVTEAGYLGFNPLECTLLAADILVKAGRPPDALATLNNILEWFMLSDDSLVSLRAAGVPEPVLSKLNALKNKEFKTEQQLSQALTNLLDKAELERFQSLVWNHVSILDNPVARADKAAAPLWHKKAELLWAAERLGEAWRA
ncbi:MAG: fused MFS/spermidine synthase, partial [Planctomycetota bacterium]